MGARPAMGMAMRFSVSVGGVSLGDWSSCTGLDAKATVHRFYDHGEYTYKRILFADVDYSPVKLTRAIDSSSAAVRDWVKDKWSTFSQPGALHAMAGLFFGDEATIRLLDAEWQEVTSWELRNVYPTGWTGPSLDADKAKVATETLELVHEGFL
ncbi:phage tail protein [Actinophytocola glycyrrhizae]|uniref:Phage tail protein n=1 Tax=Actinophytocola glycyrrhizae TaxID=2044873 RepID=A0ABV9S108_9PSEU